MESNIHSMEFIHFGLAVLLGALGLFFLYIGWRRGIRFRFYDYQGNKKEKLRDNFLSVFTIGTAIVCFFPIITPATSWEFAIPIGLGLILAVTPIAMLGAYWSTFLSETLTRGTIYKSDVFGLSSRYAKLPLKWYEFTPFPFVVGCAVFYLTYTLISASAKATMITTESAIYAGLAGGALVAFLVTIGIYSKFRNA